MVRIEAVMGLLVGSVIVILVPALVLIAVIAGLIQEVTLEAQMVVAQSFGTIVVLYDLGIACLSLSRGMPSWAVGEAFVAFP